jgi:hypothetical protein
VSLHQFLAARYRACGFFLLKVCFDGVKVHKNTPLVVSLSPHEQGVLAYGLRQSW